MIDVDLIIDAICMIIDEVFPSSIAVLDRYFGNKVVSYVLIGIKVLLIFYLIFRFGYLYFIKGQSKYKVNIYLKLFICMILLLVICRDIYRSFVKADCTKFKDSD